MSINLVELNEALIKVVFGGAFNSLLKKLNERQYVFYVIDFELPNDRYHPLNNDEMELSEFKHKSSFDYAANQVGEYWYFLLRFREIDKGVTFLVNSLLYSGILSRWDGEKRVEFPDVFASEIQRWIDEEAIKSPYMINLWKEQVLTRLKGTEDGKE